MIKMMMTQSKGEAAKVEAFFKDILKAYADGKEYCDTDCYCEETDSFSDYTIGGVSIPRGSLVYVYRGIGNGEAVWDIYKFGYNGEFVASKDNEGDVAGLVNAGDTWFPF